MSDSEFDIDDLDFDEILELAENPNTPPEVLTELAECDGLDVREAVAGNPNTPPEALAELVEDEYDDVRDAAVGNPNATDAIREQYARDEADTDAAYVAADDENTPLDVLAELAKSNNDNLRERAAENLKKRQQH